MRYVDAHYRTIASARGRAIGGLSEGGYGAINIALHHPREFSVVESWSGYERPDKLRSIFGPKLELLAANDPRLLVRTWRRVCASSDTYFWFYSGSTDRCTTQNAAFARELAALGVSHKYRARVRRPQLGALARQRTGRRISRRRRGSRMRRVARSVAAIVLSLGVLVAATGWLYSCARRVAAAGAGRARRARARRALASRQRLASLVFLAVWGVAAVLLGLSRAGRAPSG